MFPPTPRRRRRQKRLQVAQAEPAEGEGGDGEEDGDEDECSITFDDLGAELAPLESISKVSRFSVPPADGQDGRDAGQEAFRDAVLLLAKTPGTPKQIAHPPLPHAVEAPRSIEPADSMGWSFMAALYADPPTNGMIMQNGREGDPFDDRLNA